MSEKNRTHVFRPEEPPEHDGKSYPELTFRKMKAKDLVASDLVKGELRKSFAIFASMADVPIQVIEDLDGDDFVRMGLEVAHLMGKSGKKAADEAKAKLMGAVAGEA